MQRSRLAADNRQEMLLRAVSRMLPLVLFQVHSNIDMELSVNASDAALQFKRQCSQNISLMLKIIRDKVNDKLGRME